METQTHFIEGPHSCITESCFGWTAEELEHWERQATNVYSNQKMSSDTRAHKHGEKIQKRTRHSRGELSGGAVGHVDDGWGCFIHHHLMLIPQTALYEVKQRAVMSVREQTGVPGSQLAMNKPPLKASNMLGKNTWGSFLRLFFLMILWLKQYVSFIP